MANAAKYDLDAVQSKSEYIKLVLILGKILIFKIHLLLLLVVLLSLQIWVNCFSGVISFDGFHLG